MSSETPSSDHGQATLVRGASIGRYVVLGLVGRGGMGEVYAAYDPELDRKVAVKLLRIKPGAGVSLNEGRQRTLREAQAIARLSHPNVVIVYDVGTFRDQVFIAMEFVEGNTVSYWVQSQARSWQEILKVFMAAGRGLAAAHDKGLVHRDDNVPIVDGDHATMVLNGAPTDPLDAPARSEMLEAQLTRTGAMMGTPAYMAPEQFLGTGTDARTDQFSFCVALYEALYGERPFAGNTMYALTNNVVQGKVREAPANADVPLWIRKILLRGLRPTVNERYPSMAALMDALGKNPAIVRRKVAVTIAGAMLPIALVFGIRQSLADHRAVCGGGPMKLAGVWELPRPGLPPPPKHARIKNAFLHSGKSYAADVHATVSRVLTGYAQSWANMYEEACEATQIRGEQSAEVLDLRMSCLQERLGGLRALTDVFGDANGDVVENAVSAANALAPLDSCADVPLLRAVVRPPEDPATRAKVADLRRRLAELKARSDAGRWKEVLKAIQSAEAEARTIGYQPLMGEILLLEGQVYGRSNDARSAEKTLVDAFWAGDASRHDEVRATAATELVFVVGYQEMKFDDAETWSGTAEAVLQRVGGHELLRAWQLNNIGAVRGLQGHLEAAMQAEQRSLALKEKALGPDHPDVG